MQQQQQGGLEPIASIEFLPSITELLAEEGSAGGDVVG